MFHFKSKKAQSALELMSNYGIMFIVIIVAVAAFLSYSGTIYNMWPIKCDLGYKFACQIDVQEDVVNFE